MQSPLCARAELDIHLAATNPFRLSTGKKVSTMMNRSSITSTTHALRSHPLKATLGALALLLLAPVAPALGDCPNLQVPAGNSVAFQAYAVGVQIYRWSGTGWSFAGPEAVLFANAGRNAVVGTHYAGPDGPTRPVWQSVSGSLVVGDGLNPQRCIVDPEAIPWLRLGAVSSEGPGAFAGVTYIQRVNTVGGKAPSVPGGSEGEVARVPYTADYLFYKADE
jgi:hypothetical protein